MLENASHKKRLLLLSEHILTYAHNAQNLPDLNKVTEISSDNFINNEDNISYK